MHRATRIRLTVFLAVMAWLVVLPPAHAYIDGGSLSVIFQSLVAGFAALGTAFVVFWGRIKAFFTRRKGQTGADGPGSDDAEPAHSAEKV